MNGRTLLAAFLLILSCSTFVFGRSLGEGDYILLTNEELEAETGYLKLELKGSGKFLSVFKLESQTGDGVVYLDPFENIFYKRTDEGFLEVASIKIYEDYAEIMSEEDTICVFPSEEYEQTLVRRGCDS